MSEQTVKGIVSIGLLILMVSGVIYAIAHRMKFGKSMGYRFIQTVVAIQCIPGVLLLTVLGEFNGETAAALLGAAMGYVFGLKSESEN